MKRNFCQLILFILFLFFFGPEVPTQAQNIRFDHLSEGLSQQTVHTILQDRQGFMWFGTRNGLNKYDGVNFVIYEHEYDDPTSLSNSNIQCLFEDDKGQLWVGTFAGGLNVMDRDLDQFKCYMHDERDPESLSHNWVQDIYQDRKGRLWISTNGGGLNLLDQATGKFTHFRHNPHDQSSLVNDHLEQVIEDEEGNLWVATQGGLDLFDNETKRFVHFLHEPDNPNSLSHSHVRALAPASDGILWVATSGGLNKLVKSSEGYAVLRYQHCANVPNSLNSKVVLSVLERPDGKVWIGTENGGINILDIHSHQVTNFKADPFGNHTLKNGSIHSIYEDNVGTVWIGTFNQGLHIVDEHRSKFNHYGQGNTFGDPRITNVATLAEDHHGNLWIGTDAGGLYHYNRSEKTYGHFLHSQSDPQSLGSDAVIGLYIDHRNNLWIGTWEGGLNRYNPLDQSFTKYLHNPEDPTSIGSNNIFSLMQDSQGRFWVTAYHNGLDLFDQENNTFKHFTHDPEDPYSLSHDDVFQIYEDSKSHIWIATIGGGLNRMNTNARGQITFTRYRHSPSDTSSISSDAVIALFEDSRGMFWVGTDGGGLNLLDRKNGQFKAYHKDDGLPNEVINGILEDDEGKLWISTNRGITCFNVETNAFSNYDISDGLQSMEFIRGSRLKSRTGELFFGGVNGFNAFNPSQVRRNPHIPAVYITDLKIFNQSVEPATKGSPLKKHISETKEIVLSHHQNVFSFEFAALNYSQASKNQYAYKLEGYDQDWQYVGTRRIAYYTKVFPGRYTFKVKGSNNDGIWNENGALLEVVITPPWWLTNWAYAGYGLLIIALLIGFRRSIINRERLKSDLRLEHLELTKMYELDQLKSRFFANISHEFRTPLTLILGPLRAMYSNTFSGDRKGQLELMIRNAERLLRLINQLLDLSKIEANKMKMKANYQDIIAFLKPIGASFTAHAGKLNIQFHQHYPQAVHMYFDADKLEKAVTNLLSNAFKYTQTGGEVWIEVNKTNKPEVQGEEALEITIKDTGIGIPQDQLRYIFNRFYQVDQRTNAQKGTGIGLSLTKELIEIQQGVITVKSEEGKGSAFSIFLPTGCEHLSDDEIVKPQPPERSSCEIIDPSVVEGSKSNKQTKEQTDHAKILVVEDNQDVRDYIRMELEQMYDILEADNGDTGFEKALNEGPDLVISDVLMPIVDGIELCKMLKTHAATRHIPLIMLTAKVTAHNQEEAMGVGADYYITKPFDSKLLELRIKNILQSRKVLKEQYAQKIIKVDPAHVQLASGDEKFIEQALACVEENISNCEFNVEEFGRKMGLSRMQLYRKLKALTGQSANEFIRSIRLKRAAQLIAQDEITIAEVTYKVGFNDLQYFRDCFRKQFGVNPSEYTLY